MSRRVSSAAAGAGDEISDEVHDKIIQNSSLVSSLSPRSSELSQYLQLIEPNTLHNDQTLEGAFVRLSLSNFDIPPLDSDLDGLTGINSGTKTAPFDHPGFFTHPYQMSNLGGQVQLDLNGSMSNIANGGSLDSLNSSRDAGNWSFWPGSGGYTSSKNMGEFLDSDQLLMRQANDLGRDLSFVPLSNRGVSALNEFIMGNNGLSSVQGLNSYGGIGEQFGLNDLRGRVVLLAKDQHWGRVLKEKMQLLTPNEVSFLYIEMINEVADLIVDPFGNHVVQSMVEYCNDDQRAHIVVTITKNNSRFLKICSNPYGGRVVEKLLERVNNHGQLVLIVYGLIPGVTKLAKDVNGHRLILYCLKNFTPEQSKHLVTAVASNCVAIATDKTGCCMLQECVKYAQGDSKKKLISEIIAHAAFLAEDCYGNYVVQHLLCLKLPGVTENVLKKLEGTFFSLASNKYGSNVVEKFFQFSDERNSSRIIMELLYHPNVAMLLIDPYGNYVMQSALVVSKGVVRSYLVRLIQVNCVMMRSNLHGKKVLERFNRITKQRHYSRITKHPM